MRRAPKPRGVPGEAALRGIDEARAALARGDAHRAVALLESVLVRVPRHPDALNLRGVAALQLGEARHGAAFLARAVAAAPREASFRENLAEALLRTGRADEALAQAARVHREAPGRSRPLALMGRAELDRGEPGAAVEPLHRAMVMGEGGSDVMLALAVALTRIGRGEEAVRACDLVLASRPADPAAWLDRGMALKSLGRLDAAADAFRRSGTSAPARYNLGLIALAAGDLAAGFAGLEARHEVSGAEHEHAIPHWRGEARSDARLLVLAEQGLGDTLLASRCFAALLPRFAHVTVCVPPPLRPLFEVCVPGPEYVTHADEAQADLWVGALSLPARLGVASFDDLPREPWLRVDGAPRPAGARPRVGLNWAGNPRYAYDAIRSTSIETFAPLLQLAGVEWVSLHRGVREHEAAAFGLPEPLRDARDFADTARVIAGLDLVISTETAVPNLSGAMGVPTAVLTTPDVDWRWRGWYPAVVACPQERPGEWPAALVGVLEFLREHLRPAA